MERTTIYLETGSLDPHYNLAFEEYVLCKRREGDYLLLWQNDNTVVVGQNQNTEEEINRDFVEAHGVHVVRRSTGGGAVYHDLGNLNYSFITDAESAEEMAARRFTEPIVRALRKLGLQAEASGRNDILVEGRKVSGTARRLVNGRLLHHGTLLFDTDPAMVAGALRVAPEKLSSKGVRSVHSRIGNIRAFLREDMELPAFWAFLKGELTRDGLTNGALTPGELAEVEALKQVKYDTWEWNFGRSPEYNAAGRYRGNAGGLEVRASIRNGNIAEIAFYGDFLSLRPLEELTESLRGCPFRRDAVSEALDHFRLEELFGEIPRENILETIFSVKPAC